MQAWIRYVVLPGYSDDFKEIENMAYFIKTLDTVERIDLLPYHALGKHKWSVLGLNYELENLFPPSLSPFTKNKRDNNFYMQQTGLYLKTLTWRENYVKYYNKILL